MTTTITLQTHGWPALVTITDCYVQPDGSRVTHTESRRMERHLTVPYHCTDTRSLAFAELTSEGWQEKPVQDGATPGIVADSDGSDGH